MMSESAVSDQLQNNTFSINKALVALELGYSDEAVLKYLDFFLGKTSVNEVAFLHVLPKFRLLQGADAAWEDKLSEILEVDQAVVEQMAAEIKDRFSQTKVQLEVSEGDPLEELLANAEENNYDLVVIGQKSQTRSHGILAKQLARKASGNTLIIPDNAGPKINRILVPFDFSKNSIRAMETAIDISKNWESPVEIVCVNVYEVPSFTMYKMSRTPSQLKEIMKDNRKEAFKIFIADQPEAIQSKIKFEVIEKDLPGVAKYLLDYQETNNCDLVVIGAKGHSRVELLLMGSVTERFLTINEKVPTLVVK